MAFMKVLLCMMAIGAVNSWSLRNQCNINIRNYVSGSWFDLEKPAAEYNATCNSGQILWNYPENKIRVNFPTTMCLRQGAGADYVTVYKDQDDTETELVFDAEGIACVTSSNDNGVSLILEGPVSRTYMAHFSYEVPTTNPSLRDRLRGLLNHLSTEASRSVHNLLQSWRIRFNLGGQ